MPARLFILLFCCLATVKADNGPDWTTYVLRAFDAIGSNSDTLRAKTQAYGSVSAWRKASEADVALVGATACAVPASALVTLPPEFIYFMKQIYDSSLGMGYLLNGTASKEDFANILAVWSGATALDETTLMLASQATGMVASSVGPDPTDSMLDDAVTRAVSAAAKGVRFTPSPSRNQVRSQAVLHLIRAKVIATLAGTMIAKKLSVKVAAKVGAKIAAKYGAKVSASIIPILSAAVCAGVNGYIMYEVLDASELYFTHLKALPNRISRLPGSSATLASLGTPRTTVPTGSINGRRNKNG